jgi:hypothetical protein
MPDSERQEKSAITYGPINNCHILVSTCGGLFMALSNAERQRRYIDKLKARAAHADALAALLAQLEVERDAASFLE